MSANSAVTPDIRTCAKKINFTTIKSMYLIINGNQEPHADGKNSNIMYVRATWCDCKICVQQPPIISLSRKDFNKFKKDNNTGDYWFLDTEKKILTRAFKQNDIKGI